MTASWVEEEVKRRNACKVKNSDALTIEHQPSLTRAKIVSHIMQGHSLVISAPCVCKDDECWWALNAPGGRWVHTDAWGR